MLNMRNHCYGPLSCSVSSGTYKHDHCPPISHFVLMHFARPLLTSRPKSLSHPPGSQHTANVTGLRGHMQNGRNQKMKFHSHQSHQSSKVCHGRQEINNKRIPFNLWPSSFPNPRLSHQLLPPSLSSPNPSPRAGEEGAESRSEAAEWFRLPVGLKMNKNFSFLTFFLCSQYFHLDAFPLLAPFSLPNLSLVLRPPRPQMCYATLL